MKRETDKTIIIDLRYVKLCERRNYDNIYRMIT